MGIRHLLVGSLVAMTLAACTPTAGEVETPTRTPAPTTPIDVVTTSPASTASAVPWAPSGQPVDLAAYAHEDGGIAFASPSGEVQCGYSVYGELTSWWCSLFGASIDLPPAPDGQCTGSYVDGSEIVPFGFAMAGGDPQARPHSICGGSSGSAAVASGSSISYRDMGCDSTEEGMICRSLVSGHGFRLSPSDYELF
jgi:hypothetical protein